MLFEINQTKLKFDNQIYNNNNKGAISSIAFGIKAPLVDGNVIRVLSRLRIVSGNPKAKLTNSLLWFLLNFSFFKNYWNRNKKKFFS